jgi:hypothetical protein
MTKFDIARNDSTSLYEVHAAGCRHTAINPRLETVVTVEATSGLVAADMFEAVNEGCLTKLGPCAR